jgi:hypothetical protein
VVVKTSHSPIDTELRHALTHRRTDFDPVPSPAAFLAAIGQF